jgi:hypothetical protein
LFARRISETEFELYARVVSRPNYVYAWRYPDGHMILSNGNHRVAALVRAGHREVPAIVQNIPSGLSIHQMGIAAEGNFVEPFLLHAPRPPVVSDYLDPNASTEGRLRALNSVVNIGLAVSRLHAPR